MTNRIRRKSTAQQSLNLESLESRVLLAADFQNPINPYDVDASESGIDVTPKDVITIINELHAPKVADPVTMQLPTLADGEEASPPYVDVDGDGYVTARDALQVINILAPQSAGADDVPTAPSAAIAGSQAALTFGLVNDTLVNTTTRHTQSNSDVAAGPQGGSVVVWQSASQDGSSWGIFGQRYEADGMQLGNEFQINTSTRGSQRNPAVAVAEDGSFLVVWKSAGQDGSSWGIYGQRFDANGNSVGSEFRVNSTTRGAQFNPDVAYISGQDEYAVTWEGRGDGDNNGIFVATVGREGVGNETLVNATTRGDQSAPSISGFDGGAAIAWHGKGVGNEHGIFMRAMGADGFITDEIMVNISDRGSQKYPAISVNDDASSIVVAWQQSPANSGVGIWARQFTDLVGSDSVIQVNQTTRGAQKGPAIDHLSDGGFAVAWYGRGEGDPFGTFSRTFDAQGNATSGEVLANQSVKSLQVRPSLAAANQGFITTWHGKAANDHLGVFARFENTEISGPFVLDPIDDRTIDEGINFNQVLTITDLDGVADNPTFTLLEGPDGANVVIGDSVTAIVWATDESDGPSTADFIVQAQDGEFITTESFTVTVNEVNVAPNLSVNDQTALVGSPLSFSATASDSDLPAQDLTFSVGDGLPSWLTFDAANGSFSGTPASGDVGTSMVTVTVTDSAGASTSETISIVVTEMTSPVAPTINDHQFMVSASAANGTTVGTVLATDANPNETLMFQIISGNEDGAYSINASTGVISVADSSGLVAGTMETLGVRVTDSEGLSADGTVIVSETDETAVVQFTLSAEDSNGNAITSVSPGQQFDLIFNAEDLRAMPEGVFAAFVDLTYPSDIVSITGDIVFSDDYDTITSGDVSTPGLVDELGGVDGINPLGGGVFEVLRIPMMVASDLPAGIPISFATSAADEMVQNAVLIYLSDDPVPTEAINYGGLTLNNSTVSELAVTANDGNETPSETGTAEFSAGTTSVLVAPTNPAYVYSTVDDAFASLDREDSNWLSNLDDDLLM